MIAAKLNKNLILATAIISFGLCSCCTERTSEKQSQERPSIFDSNPHALETTANHEQGFKENAAIVRALIGQVEFSYDNSHWDALRIRMKLNPGVMLRTSWDGRMDLCLNAEAVLRLMPNSALVLVNNESRTDAIVDKVSTRILIDLQQGSLLGAAKDFGDDSTFRIRNLKGVAEIREKEFMICHKGRFCSSGPILFLTTKTSHLIKRGESFDPLTEKTTTKPSEDWTPTCLKLTLEQTSAEDVLPPLDQILVPDLPGLSPFSDGLINAKRALNDLPPLQPTQVLCQNHSVCGTAQRVTVNFAVINFDCD